MSLDVTRLARALDRHGPVARIVVAQARGSVPRGAGTEMLVWDGGSDGTIGGGALEWRAMAMARDVLRSGTARVERLALGPALGQCCGGSTTLVIERLDAVPPLPWARRLEGNAPPPPDGTIGWQDGWMVDDAARPHRHVWIWGAGHVGRAIVDVLSPLPGFAVTWIDMAADRFPEGDAPDRLIAIDPPQAMPHAPADADHLILTHSHDLDFGLCHAALTRGFGSCGLIGSATKWARFRKRLVAMGHSVDAVDRIACPIGDPKLGKHPQAIAVGVVRCLLSA
ncbi:xanthine dehydrogenase accessory protein XdhC [Jannaschia sp. LMIT008]|uniref:xanthine dehydrogenase accessory protein XdhC n=1 Tax=Jannaschia maritima TaxID=3032585 RepID=UPI002811E0BA|nr:xanthine dehydrogenase accessory protein XdhC [Jannaschia sp. LMIT008]